jgi:predicted ATP-binding protein involved in virulence
LTAGLSYRKNLPSEKQRQLAEKLRSEALYINSVDSLILLARLGHLTVEEEGLLFDAIFDDVESSGSANILVRVLDDTNDTLTVERRAHLLSVILARSDNSFTRSLAIDELRSIFQLRKSGLSEPERWDALALPAPGPTIETRNFFDIVQIKSIVLKNIRPIKMIELRPKLSDNVGQWIVLVGPNGSGKTTILRSLCIALRNTDDPTIWPRNSLSLDWKRRDTDGKPAGQPYISVEMQGGKKSEVTIREGITRAYIRDTSVPGPITPFTFAYGCRRGAATGGSHRQVDLTEKDGPEIATLFDDSCSLIHAETWLISLHSASFDDHQAAQILNNVRKAVAKLLELDDVLIKEHEVWVVQKGRSDLPLGALSDGYLTSAGWLIDLIARWIHTAQQHAVDVPEDFLSQMTGVVLIDEIDVHLHPAWQVEIIHRTKQIMPRMSFVVTTHNPMTLAGVSADQIWVLKQAEADIQARVGVDDPAMLTGAGLYQEYFALRDVYPSEIGGKLSEFTFLSRLASRSEAEEQSLAKLREELETQGMLPEWAVSAEIE